MNIQKLTIEIDLDEPKQLYDFQLLNCRTWMSNKGITEVFKWYCNFYEIGEKEAKKIEPRFRNFWSGRIKDEPTLAKYMDMIETIKNS